MKVPDFFLVGAPKCGTSSMDDYLRQHPEIFIPKGKEFHYFGADLMRKRYQYTRSEYLALFEGARDGQRIGESSVFYLYSATAAKEIRDFNPRAQILIMLRNPTDMIHSCHAQLRFGGLEEIDDFEAALDAEPERARAARADPARPGQRDVLLYRQVGKYAEQVARYFDVFGRSAVHVTLFDDFQQDPLSAYREVLGFLGVDPGFEPSLEVVNPAKQPRSALLRSLTVRPPGLARSLARALLPPPVRHRIVGKLIELNASRQPNPALDPELRRRLQAEFASDVERLGRLLERDLGGWSRPRDRASASSSAP